MGVVDCQRIYEAFYKDPGFADFDRLIVAGVLAFKGGSGKSSELKAMQAELSRASLSRINWDSVSRMQFEAILRRDGNLWLEAAIQ